MVQPNIAANMAEMSNSTPRKEFFDHSRTDTVKAGTEMKRALDEAPNPFRSGATDGRIITMDDIVGRRAEEETASDDFYVATKIFAIADTVMPSEVFFKYKLIHRSELGKYNFIMQTGSNLQQASNYVILGGSLQLTNCLLALDTITELSRDGGHRLKAAMSKPFNIKNYPSIYETYERFKPIGVSKGENARNGAGTRMEKTGNQDDISFKKFSGFLSNPSSMSIINLITASHDTEIANMVHPTLSQTGHYVTYVLTYKKIKNNQVYRFPSLPPFFTNKQIKKAFPYLERLNISDGTITVKFSDNRNDFIYIPQWKVVLHGTPNITGLQAAPVDFSESENEQLLDTSSGGPGCKGDKTAIMLQYPYMAVRLGQIIAPPTLYSGYGADDSYDDERMCVDQEYTRRVYVGTNDGNLRTVINMKEYQG